MDPCTVKYLLLLSTYIHLTSAGFHSLQYFHTAVTQGTNFPEYIVVGLVDGEQFDYYDSDTEKMIPKTQWIEKISVNDSDYWNRVTEKARATQKTFIDNVGTLMQRFNQTVGVHTFQWMYSCELDDNGSERGHMRFDYDGEDFISLDLNTGTWTAANAKAVITKQKWDGEYAAKQKEYLRNKCVDWLKQYVGYRRSTLERKVPPEVSLFQKDPSSPVVCHATGFYPKAVNITWKKNGEDLDEGVELRETLPNQNGTFQRRSILNVSPEELDKHNYTCVVQHGGLEKEMVLQTSDRRVLTGGGSAGIIVGVVIGVVVVVLLLVIIGCVGFFIWKKKLSGFKPVQNPSGSDGDSTGSLLNISTTSSE